MEKLVKNLEESLISAIWDSRLTLSDQIKEISDKINAMNVAKAKEDLNVPKSEEDCGFVGSGVSGEVYKVYDKTANKYFALKCIPLRNNLIPPWIAREMSMLYDLNHDNIVKLMKVHPCKSHLYLLLEYAGVDLRAFLQDKAEKVPVKLIKDWLRQLLSAVSYLHERDIIHRDLKPENMIIGSDLKLKITDFGSARRLKDAARLTPNATTLIFMSPEMLMGDENYGKAIDMWSVGCTLVEMVEKESPFAAKHGQSSPSSVLKEIFRKMGNPRKGSKLLSLPHYPKDEQEYLEESDAVTSLVPSLDVEGNDLLKKLLMVDPNERITAVEALSHPFLEEQPPVEESAEEQPELPLEESGQQQQPLVEEVGQEQPLVEGIVEEQPIVEHLQAPIEEQQEAANVKHHMRLRARNRHTPKCETENCYERIRKK